MNRAITTVSLLLGITLSTGCSGPNHEAAIRQRFQQAAGHLCRKEVEACVPLVDPLFVRGQGSDAVKFRLGIIAALFNIGGLTESDVRIDKVHVAEDKKSATVDFSLRDKQTDVWKSQQSTKWVLSDGQWYLAF